MDVNVHPTKAEVRFLDQGLVHEVLRRAIVDALGAHGRAGAGARVEPVPAALAATGPARCRSDSGGPCAPACRARRPGSTGRRTRRAAALGASRLEPDARVGDARPGAQDVAALIRPMTPLGQFRNTFIIAVDDEGLAIIDQHVAHERILFEQISERLTSRALESQRLLTPVVLEVSAGEHQTLLTHARGARRGSASRSKTSAASSLRVAAVPAILDWTRSETALRAVAVDLDGLAPGAGVDEALAPHGGDDGVSRGGQGERPAHAREDAVPARRAAAHVALVGLPARAAGRAAADAARDRAELRADLI